MWSLHAILQPSSLRSSLNHKTEKPTSGPQGLSFSDELVDNTTAELVDRFQVVELRDLNTDRRCRLKLVTCGHPSSLPVLPGFGAANLVECHQLLFLSLMYDLII